MPGQTHGSPPPKPPPVPNSSSVNIPRGRSPTAESTSRATSIARLASSPAASNNAHPTSNGFNAPSGAPLAGSSAQGSLPGPGQSALATSLRVSNGQSPQRHRTSSARPSSPSQTGNGIQSGDQQSTYGSFDARSGQATHGRASPALKENPEIIRRHLVQSSDLENSNEGGRTHERNSRSKNGSPELDKDAEFSSLQLQGGDITRGVYRWTEGAEAQSQLGSRVKRSQSFQVTRPEPESTVLDINSIKAPGGFRRNYLRRQPHGTSPAHREPVTSSDSRHPYKESSPRLFTQSFLEFLTLYGHFAGEELEEDDEQLQPGEYFDYDEYSDDFLPASDGELEDSDPDEGAALLTPNTSGRRRRKRKERPPTGTSSPTRAAFLLLKAFVGTGVLFLPRAYRNGGLFFSNMVMLAIALLNYYCLLLLVRSHEKIGRSFGDMGGILYGNYMRVLILGSIALSQVGFVSTYTIFTAENLQAFIAAVSGCRIWIDTKFLILIQLMVLIPFSLIRDISKLGFTALVADVFITMGLIYLGQYDVRTLTANHGVSDVINFNARDWTLFVGTAIFTFEGIGLVIPVKEAMRQPAKFPSVLAGVLIVITLIYIIVGALSYAAFGSSTKTLVLLNLPQNNKFVNMVQLLYSVAILLSTPVQLFPVIRIAENGLFTRSGKYHPYIKWKKNAFRLFLVVLCAVIAWGGAADLDKFVAINGSFACVPLVFIYPVGFPSASQEA